ncbi:adhesive plaque matrix protein 2-like [Saccostrea cucullata]|uniref:adhesive plaque matrix protein 2-like n=1 Tax=Saccostrea cuccullata TaxID=36930 RepID=UPI002ED11012
MPILFIFTLIYLASNNHLSGVIAKSFDPCQPNPCENGGTCFPDNGDFRCECAGIYIPPFCDTFQVYPDPEQSTYKNSPF